MIKAEVDKAELQRSLRKYSKQFGESSSQAVVRWSVQTCRELAFETLPFGNKSGKAKAAQKAAIERDTGRVMNVVQKMPRKSKNVRILKSPAQVIGWMDQNRTSDNRTKKLPKSERMVCTRRTFNAAVRLMMAHAGIAKGGFIGAGQDIARAQKGASKITIGKSYLGYTQKHSRFGRATKPRSGFKPAAKIQNTAEHTALKYVLKKSSIKKAIDFGLKKTIKWYSRTIRALDKKKS